MRHLLIPLLTLLLAACTANDGGDERWIGTWQVTSITDGEGHELLGDEALFWKFQSSIVEMTATADEGFTYRNVYGSWWCDDGSLYLNFGHSDDQYAPGTGIYEPYPFTQLRPKTNRLYILEESARRRTLQLEQSDIVYTLRRRG